MNFLLTNPNLFMDKIIKEFREDVGKELGYISGIFMSQGNTKAKNIIMPTEELEEALDRIGLYLFKAQKAQKQDLLKKIEDMKRYDLPEVSEEPNSSNYLNYGYNSALEDIKQLLKETILL